MSVESDTIPLAELRHDAAAVMRRVQETGGPLLITDEGVAAAILLGVEAYKQAERERQLLRLLVRGEQEIAAGVGYDLAAVLAEADTVLADGPR
jgi:prevent-host-death family protein